MYICIYYYYYHYDYITIIVISTSYIHLLHPLVVSISYIPLDLTSDALSTSYISYIQYAIHQLYSSIISIR
jgi:hypothetical protein